MKAGAQVALALGIGYVLGRRRKMRLTTMLAVGVATGGAARLGPAALRQGSKYLGKTDIAGALGPQVTEIVNTVRGELLDAAKAAAAAAVTSRIDSLSDSLHDRAETLRNPEAAVGKAGEAVGETAGRAGETVGRAGETAVRAGGSLAGQRRRRREADAEDEAGPERSAEERGSGRVRRARSRVSRAARSEPDEYDEPEDEYEEEELDEAPPDEADELEQDEAEEPAPRRRRSTRSPVVRARR